MTFASTAVLAETTGSDIDQSGGGSKTTNTQQAKPAQATRNKTASARKPGKAMTRRNVRRAKYLPMAKSMKPSGLPIALVDAVITMESGYNPSARGASGEIGLMQVKPATARMVRSLTGVRGGSLSVPVNNLRIGMAYLNWCYKRAKRHVPATIGCYNAGPGNMWKWHKFAVTRKYVSFVRKRVK
ncbi:MAG: lytic transglycosylase domain-containing protein [Rhizobiales bacterium]|nr:lytic transglycosylase domain-containing protein [Hyphomicrobiales bacterium]